MIKHPCAKNCPDRCSECHSFCSDYKEFEKAKRKMYDEKKSRADSSVPIPRNVLIAEKRRKR